MFTSEDFKFNGVKASSFGLKLIRMDSSMFVEEPIAGNANLTEIDFINDFKPYLYKVRRSPIEFNLQLALVDAGDQPVEWTLEKKRAIYNWLFHNSYQELVFDDEPDVYYYAMALGDLKLKTNHGKGYIEANFRTNSPYAWSKPETVVINGSASVATEGFLLSIANKPKPVYDKVYFKVLLNRIGGTAVDPYFAVGTLANINTIKINNSKISGINYVLFDGLTKTVWSSNSSWANLTPLYQHRVLANKDNFPYLTYSHTGGISLAAGWNATIKYQYPILR